MKKLLEYSEKLKHLVRTGWKNHCVPSPETVGAHSYQMALMAMKLSHDYNDYCNFNKVIQLCLVHDLAESIIGDITPSETAYQTKTKIELSAMKSISTEAHFPMAYELFIEYIAQETLEAKLTQDLDKLDMYIQAKDYQQKYPHLNLSEFEQSATKSIKTDLGKKLLAEFSA